MDARRRVIVVVLDGVGVGPLPDAAAYGDEGSNTLGNTARRMHGLTLPNLQRWGLGCVGEIEGVPPTDTPLASHGRMREASAGKDSTSGHWELMGCPVAHPFPTYPDGFPAEVTHIVAEIAGAPPLGNVVASGTEIIEELGEEHLRTARPILYTSADSVLQLAVHTKVWPVSKLHAVCAAIRARLGPPHQVARVIARPFFGEPGGFVRTQDRKDFTVPPLKPTALDAVNAAGLPVIGIGKISDLFGGRGLTASRPAKGLDIGLEEILAVLATTETGLVLANLGEFDTLWGHRNDVAGFAKGLGEFDHWLSDLERALRPGKDLVVITGDHGCDPTTPSTDHSREYVPLLVWNGATGNPLGERQSFADVAATLVAFLGIPAELAGASFLDQLPALPVAAAPPPDGEARGEEDAAESPDASAGVAEPSEPLTGSDQTTLVPHAEEIAQLVREIQEDLPFAGNLFHTVLRQEGQISAESLAAFRAREQEQMTFVGHLLVAEGVLTHDGLAELLSLALARWLDQGGQLVGEIRTLFESRHKGTFWGENLLDEGLLSEEQLAAFYVRACGIPYLQLSGYRVPKEAQEALPREAAVAIGVLPIAKEGNCVTVATSRPADSRLIEEVESLTSCTARPVLAMRGQLLEALGAIYVHAREEPAPEPALPTEDRQAPPEQPPPSRQPEETPAPPDPELAWLLHAAKAMTKNSYAPHSRLYVGAAVLADNGEVFAGCNVENDSFGLSMCAERVAVFKAISSGRRGIKAVAVVADGVRGIRPCGACLQVARQFGADVIFVFEKAGGGVETATLADLLPQAFVLGDKEA